MATPNNASAAGAASTLADKTRIAVRIPSELYTRLSARGGRRGMADVVTKALERELAPPPTVESRFGCPCSRTWAGCCWPTCDPDKDTTLPDE
jgi:hypothetical protein